MNDADVRESGMQFANFLLRAGELVQRASTSGLMNLVNLEAIQDTVEEYVTLLGDEELWDDTDDNDDGLVDADEEFELRVYDEP